jgi:hypothetical protein
MAENTMLTASTSIEAPPEKIYALVSDLTRMGEWSPEAVGGKWVGGTGPAPGVKFKGNNAHGSKKWSTVVEVTEASEPKRFAFATKVGPIVVAEWAYSIESSDAGCTVTESWVDKRNAVISFVGKYLTGVDDRVAHTQSMLESTLTKLKQTAESNG